MNNEIEINKYQLLLERLRVILPKFSDMAIECGGIIAEIIDTVPDGFNKICADMAGVPPGRIRALANVGRGITLPELYTDGRISRRVLCLPLATQKQLAAGPIEFLCEDGQVRNQCVYELSSSDIAQLARPDGALRSPAEQARFKAAKAVKPLTFDPTKGYSVDSKNHCVIDPAGHKLSVKQLLEWARQAS